MVISVPTLGPLPVAIYPFLMAPIVNSVCFPRKYVTTMTLIPQNLTNAAGRPIGISKIRAFSYEIKGVSDLLCGV